MNMFDCVHLRLPEWFEAVVPPLMTAPGRATVTEP